MRVRHECRLECRVQPALQASGLTSWIARQLGERPLRGVRGRDDLSVEHTPGALSAAFSSLRGVAHVLVRHGQSRPSDRLRSRLAYNTGAAQRVQSTNRHERNPMAPRYFSSSTSVLGRSLPPQASRSATVIIIPIMTTLVLIAFMFCLYRTAMKKGMRRRHDHDASIQLGTQPACSGADAHEQSEQLQRQSTVRKLY